MKVSDFVVDFLVKKGVTDVFGIPGGVVLSFLDSVGKRKGEITARLNYNEQASAFAVCGYAQATGKLSVAYATRGPGITNMVTGIADSYCESLPILFFTAHTHISKLSGVRIEANQEVDTITMMSSITKYAVRIERSDELVYELEKAYHIAVSGRPGPVLIDFLSSVLNEDIDVETCKKFIPETNDYGEGICPAVGTIKQELMKAKRPVVLVGDGIRQSGTVGNARELIEKWRIPVLSSRSAQDIVPDSENCFGYIGSHAMRYSNFILSKCDLIISLGNSVMFNPESESFCRVAEKAKIIRIDIDKEEFQREIPNSICINADIKILMQELLTSDILWEDSTGWVETCRKIRTALDGSDIDFPINVMADIINAMELQAVITSDVGNNEFWLSRAYALSGSSNRILYSKSYGALGCSLPKAIGAYYSCSQRVLCFTGDQGLQMNIQELQFVAHEKLPIKIIVVNNSSSGMIREQQKKHFSSRFQGTTLDSGYSVPDFKKIAEAFGIEYYLVGDKSDISFISEVLNVDVPVIIEIRLDEQICGIPYLPRGALLQDLEPKLDRCLYNELDEL